MGRGCSIASPLCSGCPRGPAFGVLPHTLFPSSAVDSGPPSTNAGLAAMTELGLLAWNSDFRGRKRSMLLLKPGDSLNGDRGLGSQSHAAPERASGPNSPPPILQRRKLRPRGEGTFSEPPDPQVPTPLPWGHPWCQTHKGSRQRNGVSQPGWTGPYRATQNLWSLDQERS